MTKNYLKLIGSGGFLKSGEEKDESVIEFINERGARVC